MNPANSPAPSTTERAIDWPHVVAFVGLTFTLTWLLNLCLLLVGGLKNPAAALVLQAQMLMPAFSAILLGTFFFRENVETQDLASLHFRANKSPSRWFCYFFLIYTLAYLAAAFAALAQPELTRFLSQIALLPTVLGALLAVVLRLVGGKRTFAGVGMAGGKPLHWLLFAVAMVLFYALQTALNAAFGLGQAVDIIALAPQLAGQNPIAVLASVALNAVIIGPFIGLLIAFGEEYGWRGYLQSELIKLGRVKGVLLLGVIWGVWHWPVILMGYNYPGQPILGAGLMVIYTILLGFVLAYAVFKSGGIWIAAFLHALNNQVLAFLNGVVYTPKDTVLSFGIGVFGSISLLLVVLLILRDPLWREQTKRGGA